MWEKWTGKRSWNMEALKKQIYEHKVAVKQGDEKNGSQNMSWIVAIPSAGRKQTGHWKRRRVQKGIRSGSEQHPDTSIKTMLTDCNLDLPYPIYSQWTCTCTYVHVNVFLCCTADEGSQTETYCSLFYILLPHIFLSQSLLTSINTAMSLYGFEKTRTCI